MEPITGGTKSVGMKRTEIGLPASWQGAVRTSKLGTRLSNRIRPDTLSTLRN